jgi:hypothetical protein
MEAERLDLCDPTADYSFLAFNNNNCLAADDSKAFAKLERVTREEKNEIKPNILLSLERGKSPRKRFCSRRKEKHKVESVNNTSQFSVSELLPYRASVDCLGCLIEGTGLE